MGASSSGMTLGLLSLRWRGLLLGRKAMTNPDSMFKSRDITLPTEVHVVKAMDFRAVMYRCESWNIKKAEAQELMLLNCGAGEGDQTSKS